MGGKKNIKIYKMLLSLSIESLTLPGNNVFLELVIALHLIKSSTPSENISVWIPKSLWWVKAANAASGIAPIPKYWTNLNEYFYSARKIF